MFISVSYTHLDVYKRQPEDSGSFSYSYDELNRLIHVSQNGKTLRSYGYDAFGNRSRKTEYPTAGELLSLIHI